MLKARLSFFLDDGSPIDHLITAVQNDRVAHVVGHCVLDDRMIEVCHPRVKVVTMDYYPPDRPRLTLAREVPTLEEAEEIDRRLTSLIGRRYDGSRLGAILVSGVSHDLAEHLIRDSGEVICCDSGLPAMQVLDGEDIIPHPVLATVGDLFWTALLDEENRWWKESSVGLATIRKQMAAAFRPSAACWEG